MPVFGFGGFFLRSHHTVDRWENPRKFPKTCREAPAVRRYRGLLVKEIPDSCSRVLFPRDAPAIPRLSISREMKTELWEWILSSFLQLETRQFARVRSIFRCDEV